MSPASLRVVVLSATGQDLRRCTHCGVCNDAPLAEQDLSLEMLLQLVTLNDDEALTSRTLWSDGVLKRSRHACPNDLNMEALLIALRHEARMRGLGPPDHASGSDAAAFAVGGGGNGESG